MYPVDAHKRAVATANLITFDTFQIHGPYEPGSKEHDHWLTAYDMAFRRAILGRA